LLDGNWLEKTGEGPSTKYIRTSKKLPVDQWRVTWLIEHSTLHQFRGCIDLYLYCRKVHQIRFYAYFYSLKNYPGRDLVQHGQYAICFATLHKQHICLKPLVPSILNNTINRMINGYLLPGKAKLIYQRPDGDFTYGELEYKSVKYNLTNIEV